MNHRKTLCSFSTNIRELLVAIAFISGIVMTSSASALPALQLGPGGTSDWTYVGGGDDTWYYNGTQPFTLNAYANAAKLHGGKGKYAWTTAPDDHDQYAYLVAAVVPDLGDIGDIFNMTISNAAQVASGYGTPPVEDTNSLTPHSIYDTYFEIFEFKFDDGSIVDISDQQPGETGTGKGYNEAFSISWTDVSIPGNLITGIHFDLFTVASGQYSSTNGIVNAFAPYSHDAQSLPPGGEPPTGIPEPGTMALFGIGLLGMGLSRVRRKRKVS